ncbi:TPA: autotransporter outer membrane beta-barrel domain-containing protein [Yersinia enterocolitica]|nr:autotransporter outer membrane beta-barrel domain-containing protein [Yersinia enterocolitica]
MGNLTIDTFGNSAHAASATLAGVVNLGSGARINTSGSTSNGINIISGGGLITGDAVTLTTGGQAANGLYVDTVGAAAGEAEVRLTGSSNLHTTGEISDGIWGAGDLTSINIENINITTDGNISYGINAQLGSKVNATRAVLSTSGEWSYGAVANLGGQISLGAGSLINTLGEHAHGLWGADENTQINASDTSIVTYGLGADSVVATNQGTVILSQDSGQLVSNHGTNFSASGGTINAVLDGSEVRNSGLLISALSDANGRQSDIYLQASNLSMQGDVLADTGSVADLSMYNAQWIGAASNGGKIEIDGLSSWNLTKNSDIASITNSGSINFMNPIPGDVLVIHGDYIGNNGSLRFNTQLGDDNSSTDKIVIEGNTSGITNVSVNNAGGQGAETLNGIEIIQVNGQSNGHFAQNGRIVAGAYDYSLVRGAGANAVNWYLNSTVAPVNPTPTPTPTPTPLTVRPEAGSYVANLATTNNMFVTRLHDRLGETQYIDALTGEHKVTSLWLRNEGGHNRSRDTSGQLSTQANRYVMQLGGDIAQWSSNTTDRFHLGVMAGYGNSKSTTVSRVSGYNAKGSTDGYSTGVYGTWYANNEDKAGRYVDSWVQYSWFNNTVEGQNLAAEEYKSKGITASVESGYTFKVGENAAKNVTYFIQPKAQVTWMGVKADDHKEANGTNVSGEGDGNIQTRLGVKAFMNGYSVQDKGKDRVFQPFIEANWIHNTKDFGTTMDNVTVKQDGAANIGELKVGVEGQMNKNINLWGNVGQQIGNKGYSDTAVMLGIKYNF